MHGTYVLEGNSTTVHIFVNADAKGIHRVFVKYLNVLI